MDLISARQYFIGDIRISGPQKSSSLFRRCKTLAEGCQGRTTLEIVRCFLKSEIRDLPLLRQFIRDFELPKRTTLRGESWQEDYRRLVDETPILLCQTLTNHEDEVLHVAFSPDGTLLSSTSKDCTIKVRI